MSKALHLVYTLHPKTLTNPLLTYNLTKPLTLTRLIEKFWPITNSPCFFHAWKFYKCFSKIGGNFSFEKNCWISWVFWFYFTFQDISSKKKFFFIFYQTDKIFLPHHQFTMFFFPYFNFFTSYSTDKSNVSGFL